MAKLRSAGVDILDVRSVLSEAKHLSPVYYQTDSHWNDLGAFTAFGALARSIEKTFPQWEVESVDDFCFSERSVAGGDLARFLGLQDQMRGRIQEMSPLQKRKAQFYREGSDEHGRDIHFEEKMVSSCATGEIPRAVVFRDSFGSALMPFLGEHFGRAVYVWSNRFDYQLIDQERPALVIVEMVERSLRWDPPPPETPPGQ
jgi:hypothetical protein